MLELEILFRDVFWLVYIQCILEIVGNIWKQKEEIIKILFDMKEFQKEINFLFGKLDWMFVVIDEFVFKDVKKDDVVWKVYKYLVVLYENCSQFIQIIEDIGIIMWEV